MMPNSRSVAAEQPAHLRTSQGRAPHFLLYGKAAAHAAETGESVTVNQHVSPLRRVVTLSERAAAGAINPRSIFASALK